jgi:sugar phosphate isomerase/epimerase
MVSAQESGISDPATILSAVQRAIPIPMLERLPRLAEAGMSYYEAHDVEITAEMAPEAVKLAKKLGLKCAMYTPSFFAAPIFKDGAMTSNDPAVRKLGLENALKAVDTTAVLGAKTMVFWNGREGFDFVLAKNGRDSFKRLVEGFNKWAPTRRRITEQKSSSPWNRSRMNHAPTCISPTSAKCFT